MSFSDAELLALADAGVTAVQLVDAIIAGREERRARRRGQPVATREGLALVASVAVSAVKPGALRMRRLRAARRGEASLDASLDPSLGVTEASQVTPDVTPVTRTQSTRKTPEVPVITSLSAERMARTLASPSVTSVTGVTLGGKKENPPDPLKKKLLPHSPKKGVSPSASPNRITHRPNWRHGSDPVFREVEALLGRSLPTDKAGGWEIRGDLIAEAEKRLGSRVTALPVASRREGEESTGPPLAMRGG